MRNRRNKHGLKYISLLLAMVLALTTPAMTLAQVLLEPGDVRLVNDLFGKQGKSETIFDNILPEEFGDIFGTSSKATPGQLASESNMASDSNIASDSTLPASGIMMSPGKLRMLKSTNSNVVKEGWQFVITGEETAYEYDLENGVLYIDGDCSVSSVTGDENPHTHRIVVRKNAELTIDGVEITPDSSLGAASGPAIKINPGVKAVLDIQGENRLTGPEYPDPDKKSPRGYAAVEVGYENPDNMADLTIVGSGTLSANGGGNSAGIGGSKPGTATGPGVYGNITIEGGEALVIEANGNTDAAGIGSSNTPGGDTSHGSYKFDEDGWGTITINSGTVRAKGAGSGAGIGGGNHVDSGKIVINGGTVTAEGASGIGSGLGSHNYSGSDGLKGAGYYYADVTINGGTIVAKGSGWGGAGIGGGGYCDAVIKITGGTIHAYAGIGDEGHNAYHHGGAGIGGGYEGHADVAISGGTIYAYAGAQEQSADSIALCGAGIGSGGAPNSKEERGTDGRCTTKGVTRLTGTAVSVSGGEVHAFGYAPDNPKGRGGAGIGGGVGADNITVEISGGNIEARGAGITADEGYPDGKIPEDLYGGAGIGSAFYPLVKTGEKTKYHVESDVDISITGGTVLAIGGWGAAGIGSGADNKTANTITISEPASVEAYADGTKFAIDTRVVDKATGLTTSMTEGRTIHGDILQGTFVHAYEYNGTKQNPEGLHSIVVTNDMTGDTRTLTKMPASYRSFAKSVKGDGNYTVYTDEKSIGQGEGRYFSKSLKDKWSHDEIEEVGVKWQVKSNALSDNFYLYPVKSIVVEKEVVLTGGLKEEAVDITLHFALQKKADGKFVTKKDGSIWLEEIRVENGKPQGRAFFVDVEDQEYDVWETDESGGSLKPGTRVPFGILKSISTRHGQGTDNNATISPTVWTDQVTVINTFEGDPTNYSIVIAKDIGVRGLLKKEDVDSTFYFVLEGENGYLQKNGETWMQSIKVTDGVPAGTVTFDNLDSLNYTPVEVNSDGRPLATGNYEGKYLNNGTIYDGLKLVDINWADPVVKDNVKTQTVTNTFEADPIVEITKEIIPEDGLDKKTVNATFYFALKNGDEYLMKDGKKWIESVTVVNGEPQTSAYFQWPGDKLYEPVEVDAEGNPLEPGTYGNIRVKSIEMSSPDIVKSTYSIVTAGNHCGPTPDPGPDPGPEPDPGPTPDPPTPVPPTPDPTPDPPTPSRGGGGGGGGGRTPRTPTPTTPTPEFEEEVLGAERNIAEPDPGLLGEFRQQPGVLGAARTGDPSRMAFWFGMMVSASIALAVVLLHRRKGSRQAKE